MNIKEQRDIVFAIQNEKETNKLIQLLDNIDTEFQIDNGTALNHAMNYKQYEVAKYLIDRGADVNAKYDGHYTPLMSAVKEESLEMVKLLIEKGADINTKDKYNKNILQMAVGADNIDIIKVLVEAGCNPFVGDNPENWSAYDSAKHMDLDDIVEYFDSIRENYK